ncbi:MAG: DUF1906 domain-containing protein [Bowdeniella nasicola]|nr:DUF1906 domain-containing protein [Bowdeniella nasicola]
MKVIDFSGVPPSAQAVRAAGYAGAVRYISPPREPWMKGKPATAAEVSDYKAHALDTAFVWQYGGASNPDAMRGARGGEDDAKAADEQLKLIKRTGYPVFFAVDFDITLDQWNSVAVHYFRAACKVLGRERVGIYGHSRVCDWAREDGVIGSAGGGKYLMWQTAAWAQPRGHVHPAAVLYQHTHNVSGPGGTKIDINDVLHTYWGQCPPDKRPKPKLPVGTELVKYLKVQPDKVRLLQKHFTPGRGGKKIRYITRHHLAGVADGNTVWGWWQTRQASAHYVIAPDTRVWQLVWDRDTAWSNANAASNAESIAIEHSNAPGKDYPITPEVIVAGARWAAALCLHYGLGRPVFGKNIRDHREFGPTSCPYHLAKGGKYHQQWMDEAQRFYDILVEAKTGNALAPRPPAPAPAEPAPDGGGDADPDETEDTMNLDTIVTGFAGGDKPIRAPLWHFILHADRNSFDALVETRVLAAQVKELRDRLDATE